MQLKQRIKNIEKRVTKDVKTMSDEELMMLTEKERKQFPNRYKAFDELLTSLSDEEVQAVRDQKVDQLSDETLLKLLDINYITN